MRVRKSEGELYLCTRSPPVKESRTARPRDDVQGPEDSGVSRVTQHDAFIFHRHSFSQTFKRDCRGFECQPAI